MIAGASARVTRDVTGDERQHLAPLIVDAERQRRAGEPGVAQVGQVRLHGQAERPQRPAHRIPDPHDPLSDAVPGQQLAFAHPQQPRLRWPGSRRRERLLMQLTFAQLS